MAEYLDLTWIKDFETFKGFDNYYRDNFGGVRPKIKISEELRMDLLKYDTAPVGEWFANRDIMKIRDWEVYIEEDINVKNILKEYGFTSVELGDNWWKCGSVYISEKVLSDLFDINNRKIKQKILEDIEEEFQAPCDYDSGSIKQGIANILKKRFGF